MRSVLGMVNFVRKVIPNLAGTIAPLVALTKKEASKEVAKRWSSEHDQAYAAVKQLLTQAPVLSSPIFLKTLRYTSTPQKQVQEHSSPSRKAMTS